MAHLYVHVTPYFGPMCSDKRDQIWLIKKKTKTENVWLSMTRPRPKMCDYQNQDQDLKCVTIKTKTKTENVWISMTRPRLLPGSVKARKSLSLIAWGEFMTHTYQPNSISLECICLLHLTTLLQGYNLSEKIKAHLIERMRLTPNIQSLDEIMA